MQKNVYFNVNNFYVCFSLRFVLKQTVVNNSMPMPPVNGKLGICLIVTITTEYATTTVKIVYGGRRNASALVKKMCMVLGTCRTLLKNDQYGIEYMCRSN